MYCLISSCLLQGAFTSVSGTFTVPDTTGQSGAGASFWVGIDGVTCTAILQTGVTAYVNGTETLYYGKETLNHASTPYLTRLFWRIAWHEWYPDYSATFSDLSISAGDVIRANVTAFSTTSGIATIENLTTGQSEHKNLSSTYPLCGKDAEWIVEDFTHNDKTIPFANFGTVTFKDGKATGPRGTNTFSGATIIEMAQNYTHVTSATIDGTSLTIKYL